RCMHPGRSRSDQSPLAAWRSPGAPRALSRKRFETKDGRMLPLTVDDLLPLEEYVTRRKEFFDAHRRYVDRYRRVRIGPRLTLIFENRQTLWYRVQEVVRIARLADARELQLELNLYNRLLPGQNLLQAALLIEIADPGQLVQELAPWRNLQGEHLRLQLGSHLLPARLI